MILAVSLVYDFVQVCLNANYVKNGRTYSEVDCYGLCYLFNRDVLKKEIPIYASYQNNQELFTKIRLGKEQIGDIISFNIKGFPTHVGVVLSKGTMFHIIENRKPIVESYNNIKWKKRVDSIWRYESSS